MPTKKADRATAVAPNEMLTKQEKINGGRALIAAMKKSTDWSNAADAQKTALDWEALINQWEANGQQIKDTRTLLDKLEGNELVLARRWDTKRRATGGAVTDFADGSRDTVHGFGWRVLGHDALPLAELPTNLRDKHSKVYGTAIATWDSSHGKYDFQVQHTINTADPSTFSGPMTSSKATFKLPAQTRGTTIYFRVRALDARLPGGATDWTSWVGVQVG
jgi:hypothetical protein